jgi:hypothetical protein
LGIGDWGLGPIPNPQSPIPNPQSPYFGFLNEFILKNNLKLNYVKINYEKILKLASKKL